jgi:SAM-dependent methyltransferase
MNTETTSPPSGLASPSCYALPPVLDACCGGRMMWFDREDSRALFVDRRCEVVERSVKAAEKRFKPINVNPDVQADFTSLPFPDASFSLVVFDPPHGFFGATSFMAKEYGTLRQPDDWQEMLKGGFAECFRVLKANGTLIFKWNETDVPVSQVLALTDAKPLFGHKSGKQMKTHWIAFLKSQGEAAETADEKPDGQAENA